MVHGGLIDCQLPSPAASPPPFPSAPSVEEARGFSRRQLLLMSDRWWWLRVSEGDGSESARRFTLDSDVRDAYSWRRLRGSGEDGGRRCPHELAGQ